MPIYILRHERRFSSPHFFTSLTEKGKKNSELLVDKIKKLNINYIYCSPFLRTIQTIKPFCIKENIKINIEYSLYEAVKINTFSYKNYLHNFEELYDEYPDFKKIINNNYKSFLNQNDIDFPEDLNKIFKRIKPFSDYLKTKHKDDNVLLVTHMTTAILIKDYFLFNKQSENDNNENEFPMGFIKKVYD